MAKIKLMKDMLKFKGYKIGRHTYGDIRIENYKDGAKLEIGSFCSINRRGVVVFLGGNHRTDWVTTSPLNYFFKMEVKRSGRQKRQWISSSTKGDVVIGNDVYIGTGATILSGVTIGDGAVIGAKAVVAKDVEPYGICVGNPGKVVKKRFSDEIIEKLLRIKWWNWDDEKIKENFYMFLNTDVEAFANKHDPKN